MACSGGSSKQKLSRQSQTIKGVDWIRPQREKRGDAMSSTVRQFVATLGVKSVLVKHLRTADLERRASSNIVVSLRNSSWTGLARGLARRCTPAISLSILLDPSACSESGKAKSPSSSAESVSLWKILGTVRRF